MDDFPDYPRQGKYCGAYGAVVFLVGVACGFMAAAFVTAVFTAVLW